MFSRMVRISCLENLCTDLGDDWVPLQKGDYCFMDAYIPQACYAIGDEGREEELVYIYSKDCNRDVAL